jgi:ABC-type transporter Mla MlaB component
MLRPAGEPEIIGRRPMTLAAVNGLPAQMIPPRPTTIVFAIEGPIARADLPGLCNRVCWLLEQSRARIAVCDVSGVGVDAVTVDALARLQLAARRHGCQVHLRRASEELRDLVAFMGLTAVLPESAGSGTSDGRPAVSRG